MRLKTVFAAAAMLVAGTFTSANASPLTYTLTGLFNGSINGTPITGGTFTWTITSDTSQLFPVGPPIVGALAITDTLDVTGFGTLLPTAPAAYFDQPSAGVDAFFTNGMFGTGITFGSAALVGYLPTASIGPTPVTLVNFHTVPTDQGDFIITDALLEFQATGSNIPEPVTLALFGAGLAGIGVMRRKRKTLA
jgi:hypothetical protein